MLLLILWDLLINSLRLRFRSKRWRISKILLHHRLLLSLRAYLGCQLLCEITSVPKLSGQRRQLFGRSLHLILLQRMADPLRLRKHLLLAGEVWMLRIWEVKSPDGVLILEVELLGYDLQLLDVVSEVGLRIQAFSQDSQEVIYSGGLQLGLDSSNAHCGLVDHLHDLPFLSILRGPPILWASKVCGCIGMGLPWEVLLNYNLRWLILVLFGAFKNRVSDAGKLLLAEHLSEGPLNLFLVSHVPIAPPERNVVSWMHNIVVSWSLGIRQVNLVLEHLDRNLILVLSMYVIWLLEWELSVVTVLLVHPLGVKNLVERILILNLLVCLHLLVLA